MSVRVTQILNQRGMCLSSNNLKGKLRAHDLGNKISRGGSGPSKGKEGWVDPSGPLRKVVSCSLAVSISPV